MDHLDLADNSFNKILQEDLAKEVDAGPVKDWSENDEDNCKSETGSIRVETTL